MSNDKDNSESQAQAQYDSIRVLVAALECDYGRLEELREMRADFCREMKEYRDTIRDEAAFELWISSIWGGSYLAKELAALESTVGECKSREDAEQRIQEDALSVDVRTDWYSPVNQTASRVLAEFRILLCTGGPACQIRGELNEHQDWGMSWTQLLRDREGNPPDEDVLLTYARCFYFGE